MAYYKDLWEFAYSAEYEYKYAGKYGAKGEKRRKRKKATPEQVKKQNQHNREKTVRRLLKANFDKGDIWATVKYPAGTRKPVGEVKKDLRAFLSALRRAYKKRGDMLKFIYRMEVGKRGGIHLHIVVNRVKGGETGLVLQDCWKDGRVHYEHVDGREGSFERLAAYITKLPDEETEKQLSFFEEKDRKEFVRYSTSRNLVHPQPERNEYRRRTMRKLLEEGPKPRPGWYIDRDSIVCGKNPYTGMSYLHYTEYRIGEGNAAGKGGRDGG